MGVYCRGYIVFISDLLVVLDDFGLVLGEFPCGNEPVTELHIDIVIDEA